MKIKTAHFGEIEYNMEKKVCFEGGLPGLEDDTEFALLSHPDSEPICWMQSLKRTPVSLPVLNPFLICPTYSFDIADSDIEKLEITDVKDVCILNVLVIPRGDPNAMTINMSAPIIINMRNRQGRQIFLNDKNYTTRMLVSDLMDQAKAGN
jgi:flagellar assembly factor FliW